MLGQLNQRPIGVTNNIAIGIGLFFLGSGAFWLLLFFTYQIDRPVWNAFVGASMNILLVIPPLTSYYFLLEWTRRRLKLIWRVASLIGLALVWMLIQRFLLYPAFGLRPEYGENLTNMVFLTTFATCLWLGVRGFQDRAKLKEALQLKKAAEQRLLDAQLTPHTLFNMSNIVYAVLLRNPSEAAPLFLAMNDMLRHLVDQADQNWTPAHTELAFMENYALLERARDPEKVNIDFDCSGDLSMPVPPMLFATLFENAVKHGRFADGRLRIQVRLRLEDDHFEFQIANELPQPSRKEAGMGIGLKAVTQRLRLLYPEQPCLQIQQTPNTFRATISVQL